MAIPSQIAIQTVCTRGEFGSLRGEWDALVEASGMASPFLFHDWFACCLERDPDRDLSVLLARAGGRLVGIAPLWLWNQTVRGIRSRVVGFISCPETGVADLIVQPDLRETIIEALLHHLFVRGGPAWDAAIFSQWPKSSPNFNVVEAAAARRHWLRFHGIASIAPYIVVSSSWEEYLAAKSYLFRKSRRGILNRMSRIPEVTVDRIREEREGVLDDLTRISERGWKHAEGHSLNASDKSRRFFEVLTRAAGRRGWLDLWILRIQGVPVAFEYDLRFGGVVHALRAEYDEAYARQSPGAYLEYVLLQAYFEEAVGKYSSGPGLDAYKLRWTEQRQTNMILTICNRTTRGRVLWCLEARVRPALRRIRDAVNRMEKARP